MSNPVFDKGVELFELKKYDEAIDIFKKLPNDNYVDFCIATCLKEIKTIDSLNKSMHIFKQLYDKKYFNETVITNFISLQTYFTKYYVDKSDYKKAIETAINGLKYLPSNHTLLYNLGHLYKCTSDYDNALIYLKKSLEHDKKHIDTYFELINIYNDRRNTKEAIECITEGLKNIGENPLLYNELGTVYSSFDQTKALECFNKGDTLTNDNKIKAKLKINLGHMYTVLGNWKKSTTAYKESMNYDPMNVISHQNYAMDLLYDDDIPYQTVINEHQRIGTQICKINKDKNVKLQKYNNPKIRIGYVSSDFFNGHPVSCFVKVMLTNYDVNKFEVYCYCNSPLGETNIYSKNVNWREIKYLTITDCIKMIMQDKIDVLVDLSGHTSGNRMDIFSNRVAKLQISCIGYPCLTGLSTIDYYISDKTFNLPKYKIIEMDHCFTHYSCNFEINQPVSPYHSELRKHITFGSLNKPNKINQKVINLWDQLLDAFPTSILMIKQVEPSKFRNSGRVIQLPLVKEFSDYVKQYDKIDISLDTFPYSGTTSSCESLINGTPLITLRDNKELRFHQNTTSSILINSGLNKFIVNDSSDYIRSIINIVDEYKQDPLYKQKVQKSFTEGHVMNTKNYIKEYEENILKCLIDK